MTLAVCLAYLPIRALPDFPARPPAHAELSYRPVSLPTADPPLKLAGAWELSADDRRLTGLSALAIDGDSFLSVSDRGAVLRFDRPGARRPMAWLADLREGPGPWGEKASRDAESLAADPDGRGFWVGYEQRHSLLLYEPGFRRILARIALAGEGWSANRGAEALAADAAGLLVFGEDGRSAIRITASDISRPEFAAPADVAGAARAPDGSIWLLLRSRGLGGIRQSLAPLVEPSAARATGAPLPLPRGMFDNFEGVAIEGRSGGGWRFWLVSDDGHRFMARTLLVAIDYDAPGHAKGPAPGAGSSNGR